MTDATTDVPTVRQIDVRGKVAVITGAASGIGAALAERLAARGTRLLLSDISSTTLQQIADRLGATALVADVSHPDDVERVVSDFGHP